jgi:hypothetical protein
MKRSLFIALAALSLTLTAAAQQTPAQNPADKPAANAVAQGTGDDAPATKEDVAAYFEAMHSHEMMTSTLDKVASAVQTSLHDQFKDMKDLPPGAEDRVSKALAQMLREYPIENMLDAMEPVIEKNYTKGELKAIVAFYSSPAGQSIQKKQPVVAAETLQAIMPLITKIQNDAAQRTREEIEKIRQEQQDTPKKS